jgi:phosphohistidine swiveling domain-containing protein
MGVFQEKSGVYFFSQKSYLKTMQVGFAQFKERGELMPLLLGFKDCWTQTDVLASAYPVARLSGLSTEELQALLPKVFEQAKTLLSVTIFAELIEKDGVRPFYEAAGGKDGEFDQFFALASRATFESVGLRMDEVLASERPAEELQPYLSDYFITPSVEETIGRRTRLLAEHGGTEGMEKEIARIREEVAQNKQSVENYSATLSTELKKVFDFIQLSLWVRDVRRKPFNALFTLASESARELLARSEVSAELTPYVYYWELAKGRLAEGSFKEELRRRPKEGIFVYVDKGGLVIHSQGVEEVKQQLLALLDGDSAIREVKGSIGFNGHVTGKVQVIQNELEFATFEQGSVLVTSMTRPEFVPLMKMASAVVTDEGGITCHAAIVSRELKLPCIIGTRNATRVFKNGDLVEVDANTGIVKVIDQA